MGKDIRAVPLQPRPNYFELKGNASVKDKIPRYPVSEMVNSSEAKSALNAMLNNATAQARDMAKAEELQAQMRTKSIESGLSVSYLEAATGMIPADLPDEARECAEGVRASAVATAERRMMEDSMEIARRAKADRDVREMIRGLAPAESGAFREGRGPL